MRANLTIQPPVVVLPLPSLEMMTLRVAFKRRPPLRRVVVRLKVVPVMWIVRAVKATRKARGVVARRSRGTARGKPARPRRFRTAV